MSEVSGRWVTVRGARVFIQDGENVNQALKRRKEGKLSKGEKQVANSITRHKEKKDKQRNGDFKERKQGRIDDQNTSSTQSPERYARGSITRNQFVEKAKKAGYYTGASKRGIRRSGSTESDIGPHPGSHASTKRSGMTHAEYMRNAKRTLSRDEYAKEFDARTRRSKRS